MKLFKAFFLPFFLFLSALAFSQIKQVQITQLKTEYAETPLGIDVKLPRFSWQMTTQSPGYRQVAYQVKVTDQAGVTVWNSGKNNDGASLNIKYAGKKLAPRTRYRWAVSVWDQKQALHTASSWFETGLMSDDSRYAGWSGAKWIGGGDADLVLYPQYLPVFKLNFTVQLDKSTGSTRAGFIFGANDERLLDRNKNHMGIQSQRDSSYVLAVIDVEPLKSNEQARVDIYRVGYKTGDSRGKPLKSFRVPVALLNEQNKYQPHTVHLSCVMGGTEIFFDGEQRENLLGNVGLNPIGQGGDYIAFPVVGDIGFYADPNQTAYFSNVQVKNYRSPSNTLYSGFPTPLVIKGTSTPTVQLSSPERNSMPMLRTMFSTSAKRVAKARLYATARGIYDVYLNGKRIGNDFFNPGLTQYTKTHLYQTFDVTAFIRSGENALGAVLGEGWWSGGSTFMGNFWNFFGDRQSLLAKLVVTYADGTEQTLVTNPDKWTYYNQGPVRYSSFFQGEVYDATREAAIKNWTLPAYAATGWKKATEVSLEGNISLDPRNKTSNMPMVDDYSGLTLTGQIGETVQAVKQLSAVAVEEVRPGVFIYDLGQNIAGVPQISLNGLPPGKKIRVRHAEVKYPDLPEYRTNSGMIMLENIRAAMAQDIYITRGGEEQIAPRFTYHGFRYIEITGIDKALPLSAVKGLALSSVHKFTSGYNTSNPDVNKLWENITWSTFANFLSVPTDCPQRNERLGWSGDISLFARTSTYLADVPQFLRRHMTAMRDVQREDGRFTDVAPLGGGFGDILWGSAGITVAWESYLQYGDKDLLAEHYQAMKSYVNYVNTLIDTRSGVLFEKNRTVWGSLGDWLSPEYDKTEKSLLWEAYFIYDMEILAKVAGILGKTDDNTWFKNRVLERKLFFNDAYINEQNGLTTYKGKSVDTQTSYAVPLALGTVAEGQKQLVADQLAATVTRENKSDKGVQLPPYSLMTGFIGTAWISTALSDNGYNHLAYKQLQQTSYPSWLYPVKQGATTIWERLNSYTHTEGFGGNNNMNSFNHYSFGAVGAWMYSRSLGIQRDENSPGFKHFVLAPEPDPTGQMTFAKGFYDSMYGRIESGWSVAGEGYSYQFVVPPNTSATLFLHAPSIDKVLDKGKAISLSKAMKVKGQQSGKVIIELAPGNYSLSVKE